MKDKILLDEEYINIMNKIDKTRFITDDKWDWEHGIGHAKRVANYIQIIMTELGYDKKTIDLGITSGLLHDIGLENGTKINHAEKSSIKVRNYLQKFNFSKEDVEIIIEAIADHSNGNNIKSIVGAVLLLADKLDITYHRVENSSINDYINNEFFKVKNVNIHFDENIMTIEYIVAHDFDYHIFNYWAKAILIPLKVAKYLNKNCIFKLNNKTYDLVKIIN